MLLYRAIYDNGLLEDGAIESIGSTSGFLVGISFGLGSAAHYWNWPRRFVKYRKQIGINGYLHAVTYTAILLVVSPNKYLEDFPSGLMTIPSGLGIVSLIILTIMFSVSNRRAVALLGTARWQFVMHMGYVAYAMLILRAGILEWETWTTWLIKPLTLPPPRLFLSVFAAAVITARLSIRQNHH